MRLEAGRSAAAGATAAALFASTDYTAIRPAGRVLRLIRPGAFCI